MNYEDLSEALVDLRAQAVKEMLGSGSSDVG